MWNKITLRIKITILTVFALTATTLGMMFLANINAQENVLTPLREMELRELQQQIYFIPRPESQILNFVTAEDFGYRLLINPIGQELFQVQSEFRIYNFAIAFGFIILGTLTAYLISGQALKPIKSLAKQVEEVGVNNLSKQLKQPNSGDEVARLTHSFNNMLEKLSHSFEMQKLFAQNAAHELKTPLASMRANIEILKLDNEPTVEECLEVLDAVATDTEQLIGLVEGLLSFNNERKTKDEIFDIRTLFIGIIDKLESEIVSKKLQIEITGVGEWNGDKTLLEQAFFNLVHNAIRYNTDNGQVKITLAENRIIIDDTGIGIPFKDLKQIFNPFYCVDSSRSKDLGGNGLGLAITKNILEQHAIDIRIFSKVGKGTKILISR